jgi:hypothetical protein
VTVVDLVAKAAGQTLNVSNNTGVVTVTGNGSSAKPWGTINVNNNNLNDGVLTVTNNYVSGTLTVSGNCNLASAATVSGNTAGTIVLSGNHTFNVNGNKGIFNNCSGSFIGAQAPYCLNWLFYLLFGI